jgi:hypothetical protein
MILTVAVAVALVDGRIAVTIGATPVVYAIVIFATVYASLRLVNHALPVWWFFERRDILHHTETNHTDLQQPKT